MDLHLYVDHIHRQLAVAADAGGDDARALVERMFAPLDATIRLTLQDALAAAAEEITTDLAPGSVELRLRGRELEFVVTAPPAETSVDDLPAEGEGRTSPDRQRDVEPSPATDGDEGGMSRINLRMPDQLKARIEVAASSEGVSVNSWLVRAASSALDQNDRLGRRDRRSAVRGQRFTGWAR